MTLDRQQAIIDNIAAADSVAKHLAVCWGLMHEHDELIAEGRLWMIEAVDQFDSTRGMKLTSWVRNYVAWRLRGEWMRRRRLKCEQMLDHSWTFEQLEGICPDTGPRPDQCAELSELCSDLGDALWSAVSPSQRRLMVSRYIIDTDRRGVCELMHIAGGTHDTHRNRAVARLRAVPVLREHL